MERRGLEYEFRIDAYTPDTIPMNRLAEYMATLAKLLGEFENVHFARLKKGSLNVAYKIEREAEPKVLERIRKARSGESLDEEARAASSMNRLLAQDNASGIIVGPEGRKIIDFPGKKRFCESPVGPFNQPGTVDGIPILVGGVNDPVPVHLQEQPGQPVHMCLASREVARKIAPHIFNTMIRAEGIGRWGRGEDGLWKQEKFTIYTFEILERIPIAEVVARLRRTPTGLERIDNPLHAVDQLREG